MKITIQRSISWICLFALLSVPACSNQNESPFHEMEIVASDVVLHVRIAGDPQAEEILIAIHGGPGNSSDYMYSLEALQSDNLAVVTYDQRGTGRSSEPSGDYTLLEYVEDLEAVRNVVGAERIHLLGHSWGGVVAMRYATVYPHRVKSIILAGSGPPSADAANAGQANLMQRIVDLQQQGVIDEELPSGGQELIVEILPAYFSDPAFEIPDELENMSFNQDTSTRTYAAIGAWDFTEEVGLLKNPVLLLWGEDDPFGLLMAEAIVNAFVSVEVDFVILDACGHYWHECPQAFLSRVRSFLAQ